MDRLRGVETISCSLDHAVKPQWPDQKLADTHYTLPHSNLCGFRPYTLGDHHHLATDI